MRVWCVCEGVVGEVWCVVWCLCEGVVCECEVWCVRVREGVIVSNVTQSCLRVRE